MTGGESAEIGRAWLLMGLGEHASVAAFARFVLHLMSLGAPPGLLQGAIRAMDDEVEHARLCFGLARKFSGEAAGPGPMDLRPVFAAPSDPASILKAAILEGCFEETISARCAQVALERAEDPAVRTALTRIVDDESRHADLSWEVVTWMLGRYRELIPIAEEAFLRGFATPEPPDETADLPLLERYGHLLARTRREVRAKTLHEEIAARIVTLLGYDPRLPVRATV